MINYISHKKSKQVVNGLPKLPTADQLKEGEIAINYANGYETLSIKNSDNEITTFSSTEQVENYLDTKLGSGFTGANSANTVTSVITSNEKIVSASLNDLNERKLDATAYTPTDLSDYYKKEETSGKTELDTALGLKAKASDLTTHTGNTTAHITANERTKWNNATSTLTSHTGNTTAHITADERTKWNGKISNAQYNKTDKKIYFYSGATTETPISNIDATDFIKDGMVSNVEIKDVASSGSCLVITFNADSGKQNIVIPVSKIFNPANYYLKNETSGKTELNTALGLKANTSDLSNYYKKTETSGSTQLTTAFNSKANATDLTSHTGDKTVHITADERTKWNNAVASSHTHANKAVLDKITTIDTELSAASNNLVVNSAITKVIVDNEKIAAASLNELNERKLDASAYTPTDLSDYYKKEETSGKTEISTALGLKANASDLAAKANTSALTAHTGNSTIHITADERAKWNNATTTLASHSGNTIVHITAAERTKWNGKLSSAQYDGANKKINFYSGATTEIPVSSIDATDFIKDGMVSNVEIKNVTNSGSCLVITFNADSGKQDINIPVSKIFNPANYYLKTETSGKTEISTALSSKANTSDLSNYYKKTETSGKTEISTALSSKANTSDLSNYYKKTETSGKTEIANALALKANSTDLATKANTTALTAHTGNSAIHITADERTKWNGKLSSVQYDKNGKTIKFYSGATTEAPVSTIDATDFIKDGMVSNVEIKDVISSGSCLVITFNADAGKQNIVIPVSKIFNPANYYLKSETSGKTEISTALNSKANTADLTAHTGNSTIHISAAERTKWNNAATSSHTHANKAVLDKITAIDTELSATSNNLVVNSAITKTIQDNEEAVSASLNDLNKRKLDATAYTPTDLSDYYKKEETSGKSEISTALSSKANTSDLANYYKKTETSGSTQLTTALGLKANTSDLSNYYKKTETSGSTQLTTAFNSKANTTHTHLSKDITDKVTAITESNSSSTNVPTVSAVMQVFKDNEETIASALNDLNNRINQLNTLIKNYDARIKALESK